MIIKLLSLVRKYAFLIFITYILIILFLSLISIDKVEVVDEDFDDKIFHMLAYLLMSLLTYNLGVKRQLKFPLLATLIFCFCYGVAIEYLQPIVSDLRVFDYYDILANTLGIVFALVLIMALKTKLKSNNHLLF